MEYSYDYYFDEKELCFYLEDKTLTFHQLYTDHIKDKATKIEDDVYYITLNNYIYQLESPGDVIFIFPDGNEKKVFISSFNHIKDILIKYQKYDFFYCKNDIKKCERFDISELAKIYPVKKIIISKKLYPELYHENSKIISDFSKLNPKNLSSSYKEYR